MKGSVVQWRAPAVAERERDSIAAKLWETQGTLRDTEAVSFFLNLSWNVLSPDVLQTNATLLAENHALYQHVAITGKRLTTLSAELRLQTDHVLSLMRDVEHWRNVAASTARQATDDVDLLAADNAELRHRIAFLEALLQSAEREVTDLKRRLEDSGPFTPAVDAAQHTPEKPKKRSKTQE